VSDILVRFYLKVEIPRHISEKKFSNIKFHKNTSSGMQTDRWTGVTMLMVAFRDFAKEPIKRSVILELLMQSKMNSRF
jgi:hypothetical protein